jgi:hypothetical protein
MNDGVKTFKTLLIDRARSRVPEDFIRTMRRSANEGHDVMTAGP